MARSKKAKAARTERWLGRDGLSKSLGTIEKTAGEFFIIVVQPVGVESSSSCSWGPTCR